MNDVGTTSSTGQWLALAGIVVLVLNHFGINVVQSDVEAVIGGVFAAVGIIHSIIAHKNLQIAAGMR